jgi:hypothetical protein
VTIGWRQNLRSASFRKVPFYVTESETGSGRKFVQHTYPYIERIVTEDTGRKPRTFEIKAFVIGDDYFTKRDNLITALDSGEPGGTLVHPFYGTLKVIVSSWKVKETREKGRMAEFDIEMEEFYEEEIDTDPSDALEGEKLSDQLFNASNANFLLQLDGPAVLAESALNTAADAAESLEKDLGVLSARNPRLSAVAFQLRRIRRSGTRILRTPELIANAYRAALFELTTSVSPRRSIGFIQRYFQYRQFIPSIKPISRVSEVEDRNNKSIAKLVEKITLSQSIRTLSSESFPTELKSELKDSVISYIDQDLETATDDEYIILYDSKTLALKFPKPKSGETLVDPNPYLAIPSIYQKTGNVDPERLQNFTANIQEIDL